MTRSELNQLRDLAQAATPGPWRVCARWGAPQEVARVNNLEVAPPDSVELSHCATDAAYIAALSPDVVLGLIDEAERLRLLLRESTAGHEVAMLRRQRDVLLDMLVRSGVRYADIARAIDRDARDARAEVGEEGEHCMRTSSDPDTRRRVPSGDEMQLVADALDGLGTKTRGR
jgi:hypothetical protein